MRARTVLCVSIALLLLGGCKHARHTATPAGPVRTYDMGFSWFPPVPDVATALHVVDTFAPRADVALILVSPPWQALLNGGDPAALVNANELGQAQYLRGRGLDVVVSIDPSNGLDRSSDAPELVAAGRSIAEAAVQQLFRGYAVAMAQLVQPHAMSLASETNLVRASAPAALYDGIRAAANDAATAVRAVDPTVQLFTTVQVEVAWGLPGGTYVGIAQDVADFPFAQVLGLSSFPFLGGIADPDLLPDDWFSRIRDDAALPVLMLEGGWPSVPVAAAAASDDAMQVRYVARNAELLDAADAIAWFQITFTDLDVAAYSPGIEPFAHLGFVTTALAAKPALAEWDRQFARPRP